MLPIEHSQPFGSAKIALRNSSGLVAERSQETVTGRISRSETSNSQPGRIRTIRTGSPFCERATVGDHVMFQVIDVYIPADIRHFLPSIEQRLVYRCIQTKVFSRRYASPPHVLAKVKSRYHVQRY